MTAPHRTSCRPTVTFDLLQPPAALQRTSPFAQNSSISDERDSDSSDESEDDDPEMKPTSSSSLAVNQAHLTPTHSGRPARNRRLPAWLVEDGVVSIPGGSHSSHGVREKQKKASVTATPSKKDRNCQSGNQISEERSDEKEQSRNRPGRSSRGRSSSTRADAHLSSPSRPVVQSSALDTAIRSSLGSKAQVPLTTGHPVATKPRTGPRPIKRPHLNGSTASTPRRKRVETEKLVQPPVKDIAYQPYIRPTSADYFFAAHASRRRGESSSGKITAAGSRTELPALTAKEVASLSRRAAMEDPLSSSGLTELAFNHYRRQYSSWKFLLLLGYTLMMYGLGSKNLVLEDFAKERADLGEADVVVIRGRTGVRPEEWLDSVEDASGIATSPAVAGGIEGRAMRIVTHYSQAFRSSSREGRRTHGENEEHVPLILVFHSLDSPSLLTPRNRICLQILSSSPHVHLIGSTTHPSSALLAGLTSSSAERGQIWVDCTTLIPMVDDCLLTGAGVRLAGLPRAFDLRAGGGVGGLTGMGARTSTTGRAAAAHGAPNTGGMTSAAEMHSSGSSGVPLLSVTAALHVLRSVTVKARALFLKLATELKNQRAGPGSGESEAELAAFSARTLPYSRLLHLTTRNFIATSEPALRALLVEFTSHGLVRLSRVDGGTSGADEERVSIGIGNEAEVNEIMDGVKKL